ncbi:MAG: response regulator [Alphaproteobacteria bacterium]
MAEIVVADDNEGIRNMLAALLGQEGHNVRLAADGRQALQLMRQAPADIVVTDVFMPEQDGLETVMALRKAFPKTAIVVMSGGSRVGYGSDFLDLASQLGARAVLAKPFEPDELIAIIADCVADSKR